jgi:hypothetical protein
VVWWQCCIPLERGRTGGHFGTKHTLGCICGLAGNGLIMSRTQWGCVAVAVIAKSGCGWESGSGLVAVWGSVGKRKKQRSFWYQTRRLYMCHQPGNESKLSLTHPIVYIYYIFPQITHLCATVATPPATSNHRSPLPHPLQPLPRHTATTATATSATTTTAMPHCNPCHCHATTATHCHRPPPLPLPTTPLPKP